MTFNKRQDAHSLRSFSGNYFQKTYEPDIVPLMSNGLFPDQASQLFILIILKYLTYFVASNGTVPPVKKGAQHRTSL
jgi:hypothetical protein